MTFSIITVTLNSAKTLQDTLNSVAEQKHVSVQHIIKDGGSTDGTIELVQASPNKLQLIEEVDIGIYDAMNQGFSYADQKYVGFISSDDFLSYETALKDIEDVFEKQNVDIVYGDIKIINKHNRVLRNWRSGKLHNGRLKSRQIPHPAFFVRRSTLLKLGQPFDPSYRISADFKQQIQLINELNSTAAHLEKYVSTMRSGGTSNASLNAIILGWKECLRAYKEVTGMSGAGFVFGKVARKIKQFIPIYR